MARVRSLVRELLHATGHNQGGWGRESYGGTLWGLLKPKDQMNQHLEILDSEFVVFTEKSDFFTSKRIILVPHVLIRRADS